ncbi:DUF4156 domain-containing protein [Shewanella donghaensis]|uniref:DUF4156 domain-containing protein n=1 Tax=Shewanella donghaensis TaxID=238836 RepID=UPI001181D46D|nr:DUF4156 domain-containing protein [Shewanella donghaensis]
MNKVNKLSTLATLLACLGLTACVSTANQNSESVAILWEGQGEMGLCQLKGNIIGSQGHWYDYLFISNKDLTQGAINQLRNDALERDANTIYLFKPKAFATSVTIMANVYDCPAS